MTRELHVYDHASGMIALLFVSPNGTVEAFDVEGFSRIGEFASVADAAAFACSDVEMPRLDPDFRSLKLEPVQRAARSSGGALSTKTKPRRLRGLAVRARARPGRTPPRPTLSCAV